MDKSKNKDPDLIITNYCYPDCEPLKNIMLLPKAEAFALASKLASLHPETTAFYRFADFENYYRLRKESDELLYREFISLGGLPELLYPLSFVLEGSDYLDRWFGYGRKTKIPLSRIPDSSVSFTYGDSVSTYQRTGRHDLITKETLFREISGFDNRADAFMDYVKEKCHYMEVQVWCDISMPAQ